MNSSDITAPNDKHPTYQALDIAQEQVAAQRETNERLSSIQAMLRFFVILTCLGLIVSIIFGIYVVVEVATDSNRQTEVDFGAPAVEQLLR